MSNAGIYGSQSRQSVLMCSALRRQSRADYAHGVTPPSSDDVGPCSVWWRGRGFGLSSKLPQCFLARHTVGHFSDMAPTTWKSADLLP